MTKARSYLSLIAYLSGILRGLTLVFIYFQNLLKAILKHAVSADISNTLKGMLKLHS
jgi:hypothetical protein